MHNFVIVDKRKSSLPLYLYNVEFNSELSRPHCIGLSWMAQGRVLEDRI